jgi:hypothetical protein
MVGRLLQSGKRILYLGIAVVGLSMAVSSYPPPESEVPVLLVVGGILAVGGIAGVIWPEKIRSGSSGPD